jgi:hypothetical protein
VSDVQVKREATSSPPPHPVQNVERVSFKYYLLLSNMLYTSFILDWQLKKRVRMEVERKQHMITALESGVSPEGLKLFNAVKRT